MERDPSLTLHFTCDGPLEILNRLDQSIFVAGDSASSYAEGRACNRHAWIWQCTATSPRVVWTRCEPWSMDAARKYIDVADAIVVVTDNASPDDLRELVRQIEGRANVVH